MYASGGWAGSRYREGGLTPQFALAVANGVPICDHAAPPPGYHYEVTPGQSGPCSLRLVKNAGSTGFGGDTGSGSNNGSGTGSNTGTGTGSGTTITTGGGGVTATSSGSSVALSPELTHALWIAAAIWVASKIFKG